MSDITDDFAPEELAMLRSFFRDEANEVLEQLTSALLRMGPERPTSDAVSELMRTTHTLKGSAGTVGLSKIVELAHALEDRFAQAKSGRLTWSAEALDAFVETVDALRALCDDVEESSSQDMLADRVAEQLRKLGAMTRPEAAPLPEEAGDVPLTEELRLEQPRAKPDIMDDGTVQEPIEETAGGPVHSGIIELPEVSGPVSGRVLRVDANRLDALMDSAGELVFDRTRIERRVQHMRGLTRELGRMRQRARAQLRSLRVAKSEDERDDVIEQFRELEADLARKVAQLTRATGALLEDSEALRRTSRSLQDGLTRMRMLSAGSLFQRLAPPLRAIARSAGKRIKLNVGGEDTEFDKSVAEQIIDPLVQILRNAVAHGIEDSETRLSQGKPAEGHITISARQSGGLVVLEVSDDGAGIDPAALRKRLVTSGRWTSARAELASDADVLRALFDAGVSTRDEADQLAGRGVGLDAVRETVTRLGGEISMSSTPRRGTKFVLRLPVTTAVSQSMLFKVRGQVYAIPNVHVIETAAVAVALGQAPQTMDLRGERIPILSLHECLGTEILFDLTSVPVLVVEYLGKRFGVTCDKVIGTRQIVVKDLGPLLAPLPLFAGATISGSGKVQLILDTSVLQHVAHPEAEAPRTPKVSDRDDPEVVGRVLVADDSPSIREAMTRMLARDGYIVDVAEDGARAWDMIRELSYDIVLTDLEMPGMNGFELIELIRESEDLRDLKVVIISSRANSSNRKRARGLGVTSFIAKPITRRKLADALRS